MNLYLASKSGETSIVCAEDEESAKEMGSGTLEVKLLGRAVTGWRRGVLVPSRDENKKSASANRSK